MADWPTTTLGAVCDSVDGVIRTGPFGSQLHRHDYVDDPAGLPVVMPKNIVEGHLDDKGIARVNDKTAARLSVHRLRIGDIVMARRGDVGRRALIDDRTDGWLCGTGSLRVSLSGSELDPIFLYYFMGTDEVIGWLHGQAVGATMPNLNTDIVRRLEVPLPPPSDQRKIAAVLAAYDELIENNLRRIEILEEMAQAVYREWFVNFRFPGHEDVAMVESPLGPIPEGWQAIEMSSFTTSQYGYTASTNEKPVGPKFLRGMDFNKQPWIDWSQVPYCPIEDGVFEKYAVRVGDVLVIRMADPGKVAIVEKDIDAVFASYVVRVTPEPQLALPYWLFYYMSSAEYQAYISGAGTGTTRKSASAGVLAGSKVALPPLAIQAGFGDCVSPLRQLLNNLLDQNANLRATRDLLLPKLVSGEIDVSDLAIDTEWLAS